MRLVSWFLLVLVALFAVDIGSAQVDETLLHRLPDPLEAERVRPKLRVPPVGDEIVNPGEFCRADGVILAWAEYVREVLTDIAQAIATDDLVYVLVGSASMEHQARSYMTSHGVNMENVVFILDANAMAENPWIRDFGPFCIHEDGDRAITDFFYGLGDGIDDIPENLADYFGLPFYQTNILHHGGNHISDGNGMAFGSTNIWQYNPGYSHAEIRAQFREYLGIDSLIVVQPMQGDMTKHIDMFCKLLNDTLFAVGEYAHPGDGYPGDYDRLNNLADLLGSLHNLHGRPFSVVRIPMLPYDGGVNRTYVNSLILNDKVLVPTYFDPIDNEALSIYAECMPNHEIIGIDSREIINYAGAVHCVTSCLHRSNPLIVFHQPIDSLEAGETPTVAFSLNPGFEDTQASAFYRPASEYEYQEVPAAWVMGRWRATLPPMTEDFSYYLFGLASPGDAHMEVYLPRYAPLEVFEVIVTNSSDVAETVPADWRLDCFPNPAYTGVTLRWTSSTLEPAELMVMDVTGRRVRTLDVPSGAWHCTWDGAGDDGRVLPSGIYFLRLRNGERTTTRPIAWLP